MPPAKVEGGRKCCVCGDVHEDFKGVPYRFYDKNGKWDKKSYLCRSCYEELPNSNKNIMKAVTNWRTGELNKYSATGKGAIGQWIIGKTIKLDDLNVKNNSFRAHIDLSDSIEVKTATLSANYWKFGDIQECRTVYLVCMDSKLKNVKRVYEIPYERLLYNTNIYIYIDFSKLSRLSKHQYIEQFEIDKKQFNDTYHRVDIPKFFSLLDLWKGKYDNEF